MLLQDVLKESNRTTLNAVSSFVRDAPLEAPSKIPAALIVTGPNIALQDLLFAQLGDAVQGRFVRLRSAEAPNLKATLRKVIRDGMRAGAAGAAGATDGEEGAVGMDVSEISLTLVVFVTGYYMATGSAMDFPSHRRGVECVFAADFCLLYRAVDISTMTWRLFMHI